MDRQCKTPFYLTVDSQDDITVYLQFSVTPTRPSLLPLGDGSGSEAVQCLEPQHGVLLLQDLNPFELYLDSKVDHTYPDLLGNLKLYISNLPFIAAQNDPSDSKHCWDCPRARGWSIYSQNQPSLAQRCCRLCLFQQGGLPNIVFQASI
jgi:hypothetical protein